MPRPDIWAVVPAKGGGNAKQRLSPALGPSARRALAMAMLEDVLAALSQSPPLAGILVVSGDSEVADLASAYGAELISDGASGSHTAAVMTAVTRFAAEGRPGLLTVPGDIPLIASDEVDRLVAAHRPGRAFTIAPAHDRRGSNAILMTPPDVVPLAFGDDSYLPHLAAARHCGIEPTIVDLPGIGLDIDHPHDLDMLIARRPVATRTWACLARYGLVA